MSIMTVAGQAAPSSLGFTQSHEHSLLRKGQSYLVSPQLWQDEPDRSLAELKAYAAAGGKAVVDAQPVGCGRMASEMRQISEASGINIVASTGFHKLVFYPEGHWIFSASEEELARLYTRELLEGMYEDGDDARPVLETKIKAGQIKTAFDTEGLTPRYEKLFRAAAASQRKTGAPLMIHVENGTDPRPLFDLLKSEGVPENRMIFCHMDRACAKLSWHKSFAQAGCFLEYDTIGRPKYHSDKRECEIISEMIRSGFADRLLLSLDTTRSRLGAYGGDIDLCYMIRTFLPLLREAGVKEKDIRKLTVDNPAAAFAW